MRQELYRVAEGLNRMVRAARLAKALGNASRLFHHAAVALLLGERTDAEVVRSD